MYIDYTHMLNKYIHFENGIFKKRFNNFLKVTLKITFKQVLRKNFFKKALL